MPLSSDTQILETSGGLVSTLRGMAGDAAQSFRPGTLFFLPETFLRHGGYASLILSHC